jgi:hypothetical protein
MFIFYLRFIYLYDRAFDSLLEVHCSIQGYDINCVEFNAVYARGSGRSGHANSAVMGEAALPDEPASTSSTSAEAGAGIAVTSSSSSKNKPIPLVKSNKVSLITVLMSHLDIEGFRNTGENAATAGKEMCYKLQVIFSYSSPILL